MKDDRVVKALKKRCIWAEVGDAGMGDENGCPIELWTYRGDGTDELIVRFKYGRWKLPCEEISLSNILLLSLGIFNPPRRTSDQAQNRR